MSTMSRRVVAGGGGTSAGAEDTASGWGDGGAGARGAGAGVADGPLQAAMLLARVPAPAGQEIRAARARFRDIILERAMLTSCAAPRRPGSAARRARRRSAS